MWYRKHGKNYQWYLDVAANGIIVKPLQSFPQLIEIDNFFLEMFNICGNDFKSIVEYCKLYGLTSDEILEAVTILNIVYSGVLDASNPT